MTAWTVKHTDRRSVWSSGPVQINATRRGVILFLGIPRGGATCAIRSLEDLLRVVEKVRARVEPGAAEAIVGVLTEGFEAHQSLAIRHHLRRAAA